MVAPSLLPRHGQYEPRGVKLTHGRGAGAATASSSLGGSRPERSAWSVGVRGWLSVRPRAPAPQGCFGGFWAEQAHADHPPVVIDPLDRIAVQLELGHDCGREVNPAGVQLGKSDRLLAGQTQSLEQPLLLRVSERHRPDCRPAGLGDAPAAAAGGGLQRPGAFRAPAGTAQTACARFAGSLLGARVHDTTTGL